MKKLMLTAAIAAGIVGIAGADISSANIVGYATAPALTLEEEAVGGTLFMVPSFKTVAGTDYSIQDIKLDPANAEPWSDCLTTISQAGDGDTVWTYFYVKDYDVYGDGSLVLTGWLGTDYLSLADVTIKQGECVIVQTTKPCAITTSGEVTQGAASKYTMDAPGSYFIGNVTPVVKKIQDFKLDPTLGAGWSDCITTISLAGDGDTVWSYFYVKDYDAFGDGSLMLTGWLGVDYMSLADVDVQPGEGLIIQTSNEGCSVEIPSAL